MAIYGQQDRARGWRVALKPARLPEALREIGGLGQGERRFAVWAWLREQDEQRRAESDADLKEALEKKGVSFSNREYFGEKASNAQAATLQKRRLSMERRGFYVMYPPTPTGRHTTHFRLTDKGRRAGEFYRRYGGLSPAQIEEAINASVENERERLTLLNSLMTRAELVFSRGDHSNFNEHYQEMGEWHRHALELKEDAERRMTVFWAFLESASPDEAQQEIEKALSQRYWFPPPPPLPIPEFTDGGTEPWPPLPERVKEELTN